MRRIFGVAVIALTLTAACAGSKTATTTSGESAKPITGPTITIGSANFTDRGQSRNIEVGAVIEDASFARALASQWRSATAAGVFVEWRSTES